MKTELYERAYKAGEQVIADMIAYAAPRPATVAGVCDGCGQSAQLIDNYGCGQYCGGCTVHDLIECENLWESVTEAVPMVGDYWFRGWDAYPRVYGAIRSGVFAGIRAAVARHTGAAVAA